MFGQESKIEAGEMDRRGKNSGKSVSTTLLQYLWIYNVCID